MDEQKISLSKEREIESAFYDGFRQSENPDWWMYVEAPKIEKISPQKIRISTQQGLTLFETSHNLSEIKNEIQGFLKERVARYARMEEKLKTIFGKNALIQHNIPLGNKERHISPVFNGRNEEIQVYLNYHLPTTMGRLKGNPFVTEEQIIASICAKLDEKEESGLDLPSRQSFINLWNKHSFPLAGEDIYELDKNGELKSIDLPKKIFEEDPILFSNYLEKIKHQKRYQEEKSREIALIKKRNGINPDERRKLLREIELRYQSLIISQKEVTSLESLFKNYFKKPPLEFGNKSPQFEVIELVEEGSLKKIPALYVKPEDLINRQGALVYFGKETKKFVSLPWDSKTKQVSQLVQ